MSEAQPRPWAISNSGDLVDSSGLVVRMAYDDESHANKALTFKAVNNFDALVAALKETVEHLGRHHGYRSILGDERIIEAATAVLAEVEKS